jgi:hypothetical protein
MAVCIQRELSSQRLQFVGFRLDGDSIELVEEIMIERQLTFSETLRKLIKKGLEEF